MSRSTILTDILYVSACTPQEWATKSKIMWRIRQHRPRRSTNCPSSLPPLLYHVFSAAPSSLVSVHTNTVGRRFTLSCRSVARAIQRNCDEASQCLRLLCGSGTWVVTVVVAVVVSAAVTVAEIVVVDIMSAGAGMAKTELLNWTSRT